MGSETLNDRADDDEGASKDHTDSPTPLINRWTDKWECTDTTDLVHRCDETSPYAFVLSVEVSQEVLLIGEQTAEQHRVEAIHGLAEESDK